MPAAKKGKAKPAAKPGRKPAIKRSPQAKKQAASAKRTNTMRSGASHSAASHGGFEDYSGKFTVRLPRSLHQALVDRAEQEGVSLNLFVTNALSRTVAGAGKGKK